MEVILQPPPTHTHTYRRTHAEAAEPRTQCTEPRCKPRAARSLSLMQIRYFTKYKFHKTAGKFYFTLYFNELNNAQEPLEKTDPGSTRGVRREDMVYDNRTVFGLHLTDKQRPKTRRRRDAPTERAATSIVK